MKKNTKITTRVYKDSVLIGRKVKDINLQAEAIIYKVKRGPETSTNIHIVIEEGDYITFTGNSDECLKLLRETI